MLWFCVFNRIYSSNIVFRTVNAFNGITNDCNSNRLRRSNCKLANGGCFHVPPTLISCFFSFSRWTASLNHYGFHRVKNLFHHNNRPSSLSFISSNLFSIISKWFRWKYSTNLFFNKYQTKRFDGVLCTNRSFQSLVIRYRLVQQLRADKSPIFNIYENVPKANDRKESAQIFNSIVTSIIEKLIRIIKWLHLFYYWRCHCVHSKSTKWYIWSENNWVYLIFRLNVMLHFKCFDHCFEQSVCMV